MNVVSSFSLFLQSRYVLLITLQAHSDDLVFTDSQPLGNSLNAFPNYFLIKTIKVHYENNCRLIFSLLTYE